jgi:P-type E1-E2 ATPase
MQSITGAGLTKLSDEELKEKVLQIAVYARTSPEDKMRIIQALQSHGHIVSMTGDGVNDAPALTPAQVVCFMNIERLICYCMQPRKKEKCVIT